MSTQQYCGACGASMPSEARFCRECGQAVTPTPASTPPRIGHYVVEHEIARGGMGVVHAARDERLGRRVALKLLRPDLAADPEFRARFIQESRAAAALDHPHILPVFDAGEQDGRLYIATRLVEGEDLRRSVERHGRLPLHRALALAGQIGAALDFAHGRGVVHRDVKPANVLVVPGAHGGADHAYLIDFGITKTDSGDPGLTATGRFMGTPDYAAPEQVTGGRVDGRADQYALAGLLSYLLTGPPPTDPLPVEVAAAIARAGEHDPARRFDSCRAFVVAAGEGVDPQRSGSGTVAEPARARPIAAPPPAVPGRHGARRWAIGAAAVLLIAGAGVLAALQLGQDDAPAQAEHRPTVRTVTRSGASLTVTQAPTTVTAPPAETVAPAVETTTTDEPTATDTSGTSAGSTGDPADASQASLDVERLRFGVIDLRGYAAEVPSSWRVAKADSLEADRPNGLQRRRTTAIDDARGVSVVIDHLIGFDTPPRENRDALDRAYTKSAEGYHRVGFDDIELSGRPTYEWRYRLVSSTGRLVRRVDLMFRDGADDFAVLATGRADLDTLATIARHVAASVTVSGDGTG